MSSSSDGASGILGVIVGVVLVIFIGAAVMMAMGKTGNSGSGFTISIPGTK